MSEKEHYTDDRHLILKALHHASISKQYFEAAVRGYTKGVKHTIGVVTSNMEANIQKVLNLMDDDLRKEIKLEIEDSLAFDEMMSRLVVLSPEKRALAEKYIASLKD